MAIQEFYWGTMKEQRQTARGGDGLWGDSLSGAASEHRHINKTAEEPSHSNVLWLRGHRHSLEYYQ